MIEVTPDESFFSYARDDTVLVLPITGFVRRDGGLVFVDDLSKEAAEQYPQLAKRWGWLVSQGITTPTFRSEEVNFLGLPDRNHYAANPDDVIIEESLWYLHNEALEKTDIVFYLYPLGEDYEKTKEILNRFDNVVLFRKDE